MSNEAIEVNFDGLVGPTHHYGGLSCGNIASRRHAGDLSSPKNAALQGLDKMKLVADLGIRQAVLPPHERPDIEALRRHGLSGSDGEVLEKAWRQAPRLLEACSSASAMWAANSATVSPSPDTKDRRLHITPANLISQAHRSLEPPVTEKILRTIFSDDEKFVLHRPLPPRIELGDEGAANHTRLCPSHGEPGLEIFVYGRTRGNAAAPKPKMFPARQGLEASRSVAQSHLLSPRRAVFTQQNPESIDAGVFHNDVISVGNQNVFMYHEQAFLDTPGAIREIRSLYSRYCRDSLVTIKVAAARVSLQQAVASYLFNSQLVTLPDNTMSLICAGECLESQASMAQIEELLQADNPIQSVRYVEIRQSMKNGGGPACLRLRVVLTPDQISAIHQPVLLTQGLYNRLRAWVERHYRDRLRPGDLADPRLLDEGRCALDELSRILHLGSIYPFQQP